MPLKVPDDIASPAMHGGKEDKAVRGRQEKGRHGKHCIPAGRQSQEVQ